MHVFSQDFANMFSQAYASFRANSQIGFRSVSQAVAINDLPSFRKDSQGFANELSQPFAKVSQVSFAIIVLCTEGFAMGTLLMSE